MKVYELVEEECHTKMLVYDMNISRLRCFHKRISKNSIKKALGNIRGQGLKVISPVMTSWRER